jgi:hypothetical protein
MMNSRFRVCSSCRKDIGWGAKYFRCSVSTCNTGKLQQYFCTLECFMAHVPVLRHRDAWAEHEQAPRGPTEEDPGTPDRDTAPARPTAPVPVASAGSPPPAEERRRKVVYSPSPEPAEAPDEEHEVMIVVSKLKQYIRNRSGMNTSDGVVAVLSDHVRQLAREAIRRAGEDGRKTVLDRDFLKVLEDS